MACMVGPNAAHSARASAAGKPVRWAITRRGLSVCSASSSSPRLGSTRRLKLSTTTSASRSSARSSSRPAAEPRSSVSRRLPRCRLVSLLPAGGRASGRSTRITSAPKSASTRVASGPATTQVKSMTRMPWRGSRGLGVRGGDPDPNPQPLTPNPLPASVAGVGTSPSSRANLSKLHTGANGRRRSCACSTSASTA